MSKMITFKGVVPMGEQEKIKLSTINGKTGYKINKFMIMSTEPGGAQHAEVVAKIFKTNQSGSVSALVDFTDNDLLAAVYYQDDNTQANVSSVDIILDQVVFNQDIFITMQDADGKTQPFNYYLELEAMNIGDLEATYLTLQNIRDITN
tara:strand:+ start:128 stop:574 length:447 start_codon:yes stop_codon:yes gene_type:complete